MRGWRRAGHMHGRYPTARWCAATAMALTLLGSSQAALAAPAVSLKANLPSGQLVGTSVTWTATGGLTKPVYRFSVGTPSGAVNVVRDYTSSPSFSWTPLQEGTYTMRVSVKASYTATATKEATASFVVKSRVTGKGAVVSRTTNPLVALYSAPACASGTLVVQFRPAGGTSWQGTAAQPCVAGRSVNVLVAGMRPATSYELRDVISSRGRSTTSAAIRFTTGRPPAALKITKFTVAQAPTNQADHSTPVIFHALIPNASSSFANPIATDLAGNLVWYYDTLHSGLTAIWPVHALPGGTVLILGNQGNRKTGDDTIREVDLAGNTVHETNVEAVDAQLASRGQAPIYMFHHDAVRLPNGYTAVLGATQKKFGKQDVMSDMVVVLDGNFQVVWSWNLFTHLTPPASFPATAPKCSVTGIFLCGLPNPNAIDWTHGNAVAWSPQDNDLIVSFRDLSLVLKLNYQNGKGDGSVVWRLGKGGDFTIQSSDPYPWFSLQHNANYITPTTVVVFDDGNTRCQNGKVAGCQSRGQIYTLDEQHHTATLVQSVNLGKFYQALGSAQGLSNGNTIYAGGFSPPSKEVEFTRAGTKVYELDSTVAEYRAYRLTGMSF